jgi:hypothetical protein
VVNAAIYPMPDVKKSNPRGIVRVHTAPDVKTSALPDDEDLRCWLDRNDASDLLGVSRQTLHDWERQGKLHPRQTMRTVRDGRTCLLHVYDPRELAKLPRRSKPNASRTPGENTALAFEMFRNGHQLDEVAIELREEPDVVTQLYERWLDMSRGRYAITPTAWDELEKHVGKFEGIASLVARVGELAREVKKYREGEAAAATTAGTTNDAAVPR